MSTTKDTQTDLPVAPNAPAVPAGGPPDVASARIGAAPEKGDTSAEAPRASAPKPKKKPAAPPPAPTSSVGRKGTRQAALGGAVSGHRDAKPAK